MNKKTLPRLDHLHRMTDTRGLLRSARGDCPDRFGGYESIDNADALRLCALGSDTIEAEPLHSLAKVYYKFLSRARCDAGRVHHGCDDMGRWRDGGNDELVHARLARALAAVIVSELPITMRLSAANWWTELIHQIDNARTPTAAATWLLAFGQLRAADPGRDLDRAASLADWLVEDCYYSIRSNDWEWFEPRWTTAAACIPAGLWAAYGLLQEQRFAKVAKVATQFVIDHLFEDGVFVPVGNHGGWIRGTKKAVFDQLPAEACSVVELLCKAEQITGSPEYRELAEGAAAWFAGNNVLKLNLIDPHSGGCSDALSVEVADPNQGSPAIISYLLTHALLSARTTVTEEPQPDMRVVPG